MLQKTIKVLEKSLNFLFSVAFILFGLELQSFTER